MALSSTISSSIAATDAIAKISITANRDSVDSLAANVVEATYSLVKSQAAYQEITKGDIGTITSVYIIVTSKPATFAGIGVEIAATIPTSSAFVMTDSFTSVGLITDKIWLKNLDTLGDATVTVILCGTNAA